PGIDTYEGHKIHSARWDHDYDFADKRVAVIGTGASGGIGVRGGQQLRSGDRAVRGQAAVLVHLDTEHVGGGDAHGVAR
ncbi:hypothetical protein H7H51_14215, partial [Mycolicibacterium farcinogenes]|nr:hypothetical protein [Mycolicibacterium farcinogenes]